MAGDCQKFLISARLPLFARGATAFANRFNKMEFQPGGSARWSYFTLVRAVLHDHASNFRAWFCGRGMSDRTGGLFFSSLLCRGGGAIRRQ